MKDGLALMDPWSEAARVLHEAHLGTEAIDCYMVAIAVLGIGAELSDPGLSATRRLRLQRHVSNLLSQVYEVPEDRLGRLRTMKKALRDVVEMARRHYPSGINDEACDELEREMLGDFLFWGVKDRPGVVKSAIEVVVEPRRFSASERWKCLHAMAKMLRCGTRSDESFRVEYSRIKL